MQANNKFNFTVNKIKNIPIPLDGKRGVYFDERVQGLNIIITDKGRKSYYVRRVIKGRSKRIRLGLVENLSIENAREMARKINHRIDRGEDPFQEKVDERNELTLRKFFHNKYIPNHAKIHKKTYQYDERQFSLYIDKQLAHKKLSELSSEGVRALHSNLGVKRPYAANRALALIRCLYNKASEWKLYNGVNPAVNIKKFKEKSRARFLQRDELPKFFESLEFEENQDIKDYIWLSLLTGARRTNILSMEWKDINFERQEWLIPETKNGDSQIISLVDRAIIILKQRNNINQQIGSKFVFFGCGKTGHMVEPKKGWKRILDRAEIENLRLHDLRRTVASYQAISGVDISTIGQCLGHKSLAATQVYARSDRKAQTEAMNISSNVIINLGKAGGINA